MPGGFDPPGIFVAESGSPDSAISGIEMLTGFCYKTSDINHFIPSICNTMPAHATESALLEAAFQMSPIARARDLRSQGISGTAIARAVEAGQLTRRGRGLYQHANAHIDAGQSLAEVSKLVPGGVICMTSALAWHGLADQMPRKVWIAIGQKEWAPKFSNPPLRIARMTDKYLRQGIELHSISGVDVPIYSIPKTLADVFRNSRAIDRSVAIEALRATLDQRRATPGEIADAANQGGTWNAMRPYLEALTSNGCRLRNMAASAQRAIQALRPLTSSPRSDRATRLPD